MHYRSIFCPYDYINYRVSAIVKHLNDKFATVPNEVGIVF